MSPPELSVVLLVGSQRGRAERVLEALAAQRDAPPLEVVVADGVPGQPPLRVPGGLDVRVVTAPGDVRYGELRALGAHAARAPVVAYLEDHAYPHDGWAAAVARAAAAHDWAGIGYAFVNANPVNYVSRAMQVAEYGEWAAPARPGPTDRLAGNNVAYRRDVLLGLGDALGGLLDVEFNLHAALRARGHRLGVAADAVVSHEHFEELLRGVEISGLYANVLARQRSSGWPLRRRLAFAALVPIAAPASRLRALVRSLPGRPGMTRRSLAVLPLVLGLYVTSALMEAVGYLRLGPDLGRRFREQELGLVRIPGSTG